MREMKGWRLFYQNPEGLTLNGRMECPKFAFIFYSSFKDESLQSLQSLQEK
jgi:hypothetical protein